MFERILLDGMHTRKSFPGLRFNGIKNILRGIMSSSDVEQNFISCPLIWNILGF